MVLIQLLNRSLVPLFRKQKFSFWLGLGLILAYWYWIHPPGFYRGYSEDQCQVGDLPRQLMSESITQKGKPGFFTESLMAPTGASIPFMPWSIEQDWIGAYVWKLDKNFPFLWVYYGFSLILSYIIVGLILGRMKLSSQAAWGLATLVVGFHVPRHLKTWHHYEHLLEHWIYIGIFLDAWIWQKAYREKKWSLNLEAWRDFALVGTFGTAGYFWGPMILEWFLVRVCLFILVKKEKVRAEWKFKSLLLPAGASLILIWIQSYWFLALFEEVLKFGPIHQDMRSGLNLFYLIRPLWIDHFLILFKSGFWSLFKPETAGSIGWIFWIPVVFGIRQGWSQWKKKSLWFALPFLIFLGIAVLYACTPTSPLHWLVQHTVPFMSFFRVKSRWGLFLPAIAGSLIALYWNEIQVQYRKNQNRKRFKLFLLLSGMELTWLFFPVNTLPVPPASFPALMDQVRALPGDTVLDLPFCVIGGNGLCLGPGYNQCSDSPRSFVGLCMREWHEKKVYGLYASRLSESNCQTYQKQPYISWFTAWTQNRCFTAGEWDGFCNYLDENPRISAVLLYPEIWQAASLCLEQFQVKLGPALAETRIATLATPGGKGEGWTRILLFPGKCRK